MNEQWANLFQTLPPDESDIPFRGRLGRKEQECADLALWEGVDQEDSLKVRAAHRAGANLERTRDGATPLFACLQKGNLLLGGLLIEFGAQVHLGTSKQGNLWKAILVRDNPQEAQQLKDWGVNIEWTDASMLAENGAFKILLWWMNQGGVVGIPLADGPPHTSDNRKLISFLAACVHGSHDLHTRLNQVWGIGESSPNFAAKWGDKTTEAFWSELAIIDDPIAAKKAIQAGWVGDSPGITGWVLMRKKSWRILEQWTQSPTFLPQMRQEAINNPQLLWRLVQDLPTYTYLARWGIDPTGVNEEGDTLAHYLFRTVAVPLNLMEWWCKRYPNTLEQTNHAGRTPANAPSSYQARNLQTLTKVRAKQLHKRFPAAPPAQRNADRL